MQQGPSNRKKSKIARKHRKRQRQKERQARETKKININISQLFYAHNHKYAETQTTKREIFRQITRCIISAIN